VAKLSLSISSLELLIKVYPLVCRAVVYNELFVYDFLYDFGELACEKYCFKFSLLRGVPGFNDTSSG
jgi:hypothetical protein